MLAPLMPVQSVSPHSSSPVPPPSTTAAINYTSIGNRNSSQNQHLFAPSSSSSSTPGSVPQNFSNTLCPGPLLNVSLSHPNLSSVGQQPQPQQHSHRAVGGGGNVGYTQHASSGLRGSSSENTSPRRSPSPMAQSRSSENVSHGGKQAGFDPFGQFNLKVLSDQGQGATRRNGTEPLSSRPTVTVHSGGLPPTGNSYRPYYMQNQSNSGTGVGGISHSRTTSAPSHATTAGSQKQGFGTKPKLAAPPFASQPRPQAPNYNPSTYSTTPSNRTGKGEIIWL